LTWILLPRQEGIMREELGSKEEIADSHVSCPNNCDAQHALQFQTKCFAMRATVEVPFLGHAILFKGHMPRDQP